MRPMTEETYNAIKARKVVGYNAPNHDLLIENYNPGYTPITQVANTIIDDPTEMADYCVLNDGRVLVASIVGQGLYLKHISSESVFNNTPMSADGGNLFYTYGRQYTGTVYHQGNCALLRLKNGRVLLFISDCGNFNTSAPYRFYIYESANGTGEDFTLKKILSEGQHLGGLNGLKASLTKPIQNTNGDIWMMASMRGGTYSGYDLGYFYIMKSSDGGLTWVIKNIYNPGWLGSGRFTYAHSFVIVGNVMFYSHGWGYFEYDHYTWMSFDGGETWTLYEYWSNFPYTNGNFRECVDFCNGNDGYIYMIYRAGGSYDDAKLYRLLVPTNLTREYMNTWSNWEFVIGGISHYSQAISYLSMSPNGDIHHMNAYNVWFKNSVLPRSVIPNRFKAGSITINKNKGSANTASLRVDNFNGVANPRNPNSELFGILNLNRRVTIRQGYGDDIVTSFTGIIDSIKMSTMPQMADIGLRDYLKVALDQMITKDGSNTVVYAKQPIENIVADLCSCAGLTVGTIEATGISIEKTFAYQSYGDAFQFLSDLASFEYLADEDGLFHFRRDYQPNSMFVAWSFNQGIDIENLSYELNDQDIYYKVRVYGRDGDNVLVYEAPFLDAPQFNILPQKVLKVDATEASTLDELKKIAQRAIATMRSRTRIIEFSTIGIPHLQIGDFIQLFEESTMSADVYRITGITLNWSDQGFMMTCKAFYYGDSVVPIELPTETATQTPNATLNLIPEMTSNTTPSGVCRASSVYVLYQNDYKPWNAFNSSSADLFWDASVNHGWIEYEFPENTIIDKYMVKARQLLEYNDAMPKAWTFEAFDGEKWIVLDTRTAQTAWQIHEMREYTFTNTTAYPKYRLNITANNGYTRLQLEQLAMYYRGGL